MTNFTAFLERLQTNIREDIPFVLYRKPHKKNFHGLLQRTKEIYNTAHYTETGFIFSAFKEDGLKLIIPSEYSDYYKGSTFLNTGAKAVVSLQDNTPTAKTHYLRLVDEAVKVILMGEAEKIVLSRKQTFKVTAFDGISCFLTLAEKYPSAFIYYWYHPKTGVWVGATPEKLISLKNKKFTTMALAGTKVVHGDLCPVWTNKEYAEQSLVTQYIQEALSRISKKLKTSGTLSVKAGNLWHLQTQITGKFKKGIALKDVLERLHPTPAVCGFPKNKAYTHILSKEDYERDYYSGFLGILDSNGSTQLFVNLRCMSLQNNTLSLYAGAGITQESVPENEWEETEQKLKTIKTLLEL